MQNAPLDRRTFLTTLAAVAVASHVRSQAPADVPSWGGPVRDCHFHLRPDLASNLAHMDGCGVSNAVILARDPTPDQLRAIQQHGDRLTWAVSTDITTDGAAERLTAAVKQGALGFGEMKFHLAADAPAFQRAYALAADLGVPILVHFQEVPHFDGEGVFATGFKTFHTMLRKFSGTTFLGHADAFWANVDAKYDDGAAYPTGPISRGGVTDLLLGDYANLFGDLSANSGNNAMSRDEEFTRDFLRRHQDKLIFGSDCSCVDGRGTGIAQANNPAAARLAGKCVARETLALLQRSTDPPLFRKLVFDNSRRIYKTR
jgi:predicted TIM-barrel fold metal-dependent hydrolase